MRCKISITIKVKIDWGCNTNIMPIYSADDLGFAVAR